MLLIYKYMLKRFVNTMLAAIFGLCVIFVVVNLLENLDDFIDAKASLSVIAKYYLYFLPDIMKLLTPVAILVSALFSVGNMSNLNEITAMKSGGMSIYRIMRPFIVLCIFISIGQIYFNGWVVPRANERKNAIEYQYLGADNAKPIQNLYYRDSPTTNVLIMYYDIIGGVARNTTIENYAGGEKSPRLLKRINAPEMRYDSVRHDWVMKDVVVRDFSGKNIRNYRIPEMRTKLNITAKKVAKMQKSTDVMTYDEYREYMDFLAMGGKDITQLEVEYYGNYAFPFADIIVILFAIPFASVKKKNGIAVQIAAAMIVAFTYLIFTKLGQSVGSSLHLNAILSGWLANIVFLGVGITVILKTKT